MTTDRNDNVQTEFTAEEQRLSKLLDEALRPDAFDESMRLELSRRIAAATTPLLGTQRAAGDFDGPVADREAEAPMPVADDAPEGPAVIGRIRPAHWFGGLIAAGLAAAVLLMVYGPASTTVTPPTQSTVTPTVAAVDEAALEAQLAHVQAFAEVDSRSAPIDEALEVFAMDLDSVYRETTWLEDNAAYGDELTTWMDDYQWPDDSFF